MQVYLKWAHLRQSEPIEVNENEIKKYGLKWQEFFGNTIQDVELKKEYSFKINNKVYKTNDGVISL